MSDMLTAKEMQSLLQVDRSTIYRMAEQQRLPAVKIGKQWRFPHDQVQQWLNSHTVQTKSQPEPAPESSLSAEHLTNLLPLSCVQLVQDTFADTLGVMLVVTDMNGTPITDVSNPCGLFSAISEVPGAVKKCIDSWRTIGADLELEPKLTPSHLGLLCARGLIRVGTELKGMVVVGGIAPDNWPPTADQVQIMATEFGVTTETLQTRLDEVFRLDQTEQARLLSTLQRIANIVTHIVNERNTLLENS